MTADTKHLPRHIDWPQRLAAALEERRETPYAWGTNDCAIFAADMVQAVTGHDLAGPFRGRYRTQAGSRRILKALGWADVEAMADTLLPRRFERPRRGDVVLYDGKDGPFLGIVWQGGVVGPGPQRPILWPPSGILACWSVG